MEFKQEQFIQDQRSNLERESDRREVERLRVARENDITELPLFSNEIVTKQESLF